MLHFKTVEEYNEKFNNPTLHPLISLVDLNKAAKFRRTKLKLDFYAVVIKDSKCGDLRYGLKYYDYAEGTIVFFGPGQVIASEPEGEWHQPYGTALIFHPDLLKGTGLARQMAEYSFFGYQSAEALHVSAQERTQIDGCFANIALEMKQNLDQHSKTLIIANLELLLKYCSRFYDRQFTTRENHHRSLMAQFDTMLNNYIYGEQISAEGLPSVAYFAQALQLSANYFSDVLKKETGKTALEFIHLKLLETAKERIRDTEKPISAIAYDLGFKYPQHFTRLFKQKVGVSPNEYRMQPITAQR